jgi:hypothetical protein
LFFLVGGDSDDADEGISSETESLLIEASSAASSHSRTWPKVLSTGMTLEDLFSVQCCRTLGVDSFRCCSGWLAA